MVHNIVHTFPDADGGPMPGGDSRKWVVVLEVDATIVEPSLNSMLQILSDVHAVALQCQSRYALQMQIVTCGQPEALFVALARWESAHRALDHPEAEVVRAEVLCQEEFERDCRLAYRDEALGGLPAGDAARPLHALN